MYGLGSGKEKPEKIKRGLRDLDIGRGGELTPVPGSPFATGDRPDSVAYSPNGQYFAVVTNSGENLSGNNGSVSVYRVGGGGGTPVPGSPFPAGTQSTSVAYSPDGLYCAVANRDSNNVSVYKVGAEGALTSIAGSPFAASKRSLYLVDCALYRGARSVAYSSNGLYCAVVDEAGVSVYRVGSGVFYKMGAKGGLTSIAGSPFSAGEDPVSVAYSPNGLYCAVANQGSNTISIYKVEGAHVNGSHTSG